MTKYYNRYVNLMLLVCFLLSQNGSRSSLRCLLSQKKKGGKKNKRDETAEIEAHSQNMIHEFISISYHFLQHL